MAARARDPGKPARVLSKHAAKMKAAGKKYRKWKEKAGQGDLSYARAMRKFQEFIK